MAAPEEINADMLAFWNGKGGETRVARQEHTDITLTPVTDALLTFAVPRACLVVPAAGQETRPPLSSNPAVRPSPGQPPRGEGWVRELKHDGYRLQVHVRDGRVRLYTMSGADWSERYPLIVKAAACIKGSAIIDAEVVCLMTRALRILMPCTVALGITRQSPVLLTC